MYSWDNAEKNVRGLDWKYKIIWIGNTKSFGLEIQNHLNWKYKII
jgi:hypothetical protein